MLEESDLLVRHLGSLNYPFEPNRRQHHNNLVDLSHLNFSDGLMNDQGYVVVMMSVGSQIL